MTKQAVIVITLSLFLCWPLPATAKLFNAESFMLDNGMQVVVIPNRRAPVVTHMVWYKFGGGDEIPGESGVAHFLEHLMFKGTPTVPSGAFSRTVKKLGGNDNAFTSHDYTAYYQNIPRNQLETVMRMEADRMKNLTLEEDEVSSERQVIIEERHQRVDNQPAAKFQEQLMATLFINHPYGTPVIGWKQEIETLTRDDALYYYSRWYAPNNAILIVSGDITATELKPLAKKYYGAIKSSLLPPRDRPKPAPLITKNIMTLEDERVGIPVISKTWRAPRGSDALDIMSEILGGTSTSRLYKSLVVEQKIAVSAGADYHPISLNDTSLTVYASPAPNVSMPQLEAALSKEIESLRKNGVTAVELADAKKRKKASLTYYLDSLQGPALLFGRALASGFDIDYLENWDARIEKLSVNDVNKAAEDVFADHNASILGALLGREKK